ncbi:MAG: hypothetical protein WC481_01870 [Candidatus Omnitrophota bacterium]
MIEKPFDRAASFRPTLICKKGNENIAIEIRNDPVFSEYFEDFVKDCLAERRPVKVYLAMPSILGEEEIALTHSFMSKANGYGVGVFLVHEKEVIEYIKSVKCNMRIGPNDCIISSRGKDKILPIISRFNKGEPIDAIRDITELVENLVDNLAKKASKKRKVVPRIKEVTDMNFETKINLLSASDWHGKHQKKHFNEDFKSDLKSFKGARNLSHHPRDKVLSKKLEQQLIERMLMGTRLSNDLLVCLFK